jgi:hypothetical protein
MICYPKRNALRIVKLVVVIAGCIAHRFAGRARFFRFLLKPATHC